MDILQTAWSTREAENDLHYVGQVKKKSFISFTSSIHSENRKQMLCQTFSKTISNSPEKLLHTVLEKLTMPNGALVIEQMVGLDFPNIFSKIK